MYDATTSARSLSLLTKEASCRQGLAGILDQRLELDYANQTSSAVLVARPPRCASRLACVFHFHVKCLSFLGDDNHVRVDPKDCSVSRRLS